MNNINKHVHSNVCIAEYIALLQREIRAYWFNLYRLHIIWSRALDAEQCNTIFIVCLIRNFLSSNVTLVSFTKPTLIIKGKKSNMVSNLHTLTNKSNSVPKRKKSKMNLKNNEALKDRMKLNWFIAFIYTSLQLIRHVQYQ